MALGDYSTEEIRRMAARASEPNADPYAVAMDAMRVAPQLRPEDLDTARAFGITPFAVLAVRLGETEAITAERDGRASSARFHEAYDRKMEAWGRAEIERLSRE